MSHKNLYDVEFNNYEESTEVIKRFFTEHVSNYDIGNDLLYKLCRDYPLKPQLSQNHGEIDKLTEQEAALADQMWLIGRAYAASPQRYIYRGKAAKPSEDYLGTEGYESFFCDIARTLLRWRKPKEPDDRIVYLRGEAVTLSKDEIKELGSVEKAISILDGRDADDTGFHPIGLSDFLEILASLHDADNAGYALDFNLHRASDGKYRFDFPDIDLTLSCITTDLVIQFAQFVSAVRMLRDAAICEESGSKPPEPSGKDHGVWKKELGDWKKTLCTGEQSLNISFSSKFLHFQLPNLFFIYDSISVKNTTMTKQTQLQCSSDHGISCEFRSTPRSVFIAFKERAGQLPHKLPNELESSERLKDYIASLPQRLNRLVSTAKDSDGTPDSGKRYFVHAIKELALARIIHDALREADCPNRYITRSVDILVTNWSKPSDEGNASKK